MVMTIEQRMVAMSAPRSIAEIDALIDANTRALVRRLRHDPGMSARDWQTAWDRCPDLKARKDALYGERGAAQLIRDRAEHEAWKLQQRRERAAQRKALAAERKGCRTCFACGTQLAA